MWLVNAALRRPYTVWVGMLLVAVLGIVSYFRTPTDILPNLKVPVVVVFASYRGMPAPDMEQTVVSVLERSLTRCDHLEHIESRSMLGIGIIKVYFRPEVDPDLAGSQVVSLVRGEMQNLPPGMLPPTILKYDASAIPVGNLVVSSDSRDDKYLLDLADHELRDELANIEGLAAAPVFGGVFRQVQIYVHPRTLEAMNLSPMDIARYVNSQSQVIPTGEIRIGQQNYYVSSNCMVQTPEDFKKIPLPLGKDGGIVYLGDIAEVVDGSRWRTNTVRVDGRRAVYMPLLRQAGASAVKVVDNVKEFLPELYERDVVPEDVRVEVKFDQSQYVRDALHGLQMEGVGGAVLASLVVLLFLGSLRSTWIVAPVDSAVDPGGFCRALPDGPHAEHHDAGRAGLGARPGGGRLDRGRGEHDPAPGHGQDAAGSGAGQRGRDFGAGADCHDHHRGRVSALDFHGRDRQVPVHAAGGQCRPGDGRFLPGVADRFAACTVLACSGRMGKRSTFPGAFSSWRWPWR